MTVPKSSLLEEITRRVNAGKTELCDRRTCSNVRSGSAVQDGELGYQTPDAHYQSSKHQVETLPEGKISAPFKTVHGWHIVEVLDHEVDRTDSASKLKHTKEFYLTVSSTKEAGAWLQVRRVLC
ncbi:peptidylprolyl isomerase [Vibrio lentus]|nr:peptidylprolyl isomerase [Vibrio lentus]